jgi:hypothetical protein
MPRGECDVRRVIQNSGVSLKILFPANKGKLSVQDCKFNKTMLFRF